MSETMFIAVLIFVFSVIALIALGARSFTQLVALILENGSKVEAVLKEIRQVQTHLSDATGTSTSSPVQKPTPTTPETPGSISKDP